MTKDEIRAKLLEADGMGVRSAVAFDLVRRTRMDYLGDPVARCAQIDLITDVVEELIIEQMARWREEHPAA